MVLNIDQTRQLELSFTSLIPCTYLVISGLVYLLIIIFIFYAKRKVRTIENFCYGLTLWLTLSASIEEIIRIILPIYVKSNVLSEVLNKLHLILIIFLVCTITMYVMVITSKKYQGRVDFKNNKYSNYFKKWFYMILGIGFIFSCLAIFSNLEVLNTPAEFTSTRAYRNVLYFIVAAFVSWIVLVLRNFDKQVRKRYITVYGLIILLFLGIAIHWYFEYYRKEIFLGLSNITAAFMLCEIFMYFTMENPDIEIIEKLNTAKENASKANADKTKFLSTMSHEIRTPLNAIIGFSQSLEEDQSINDNAKEELNDIIMSSESLLEIVNGILDISKIEEDIIEITPFEYSFKKLTNEVISLARSRLASSSKPIEFEYSVDDKIPPVLKGDAGKIKEIIINFLTNAIKYTEKGKVKFSVTGEVKGNYCTLAMSVSDTGMGIKEEDINKLFTKFQRFDLEKNNSVEGTGLGLSISKKMIELMNGKVDVKSVYGQGSTFSVIVDQEIINKQSLEGDEKLSSQPFDASGQTIIVVDDNEINLKVAEKELSKYKVNVESFIDHEQFIESIKQGKTCKVIFLDDGMPEETKVLPRLKEIPGFKIPVIAYTANAINGIRDKYLEAGYDEYLSKPVDKKELRRVLKMYLSENGQPVEVPVSAPVEVPVSTPATPVAPVEATPAIAAELTPTAPVAETPAPVAAPAVAAAPVTETVAPATPVEATPAPAEVVTPPVAITPQQPVEVPVSAPVEVPVSAPAPAPVAQPVETPVAAPVEVPVTPAAPTVEATPAVETPAPAPVTETVAAPAEVTPAPAVEEPMVPPVAITPQQPVEVPVAQSVETPAATPVEAPVSAPASSVPASHTREYLEANKCDVNKALESLGDMDTYDIAAEEFVAEFENNMGKIKTAKEAGDMANYAIETHGLKSNARYMGFEDLGNMSYDHEMAGKENNVDFVNTNYDALMNEANRVYGVLKNYMEN